MKDRTRAFTMIELVMVVVVISTIAVLLLPAMKRRWNAGAEVDSIKNVRQILRANAQYRLDHADRVPMRGASYSNGQITGGWDTWHHAGKNCDQFWQATGGAFDESAFGRFLNPYLSTTLAPMPPGYINTGAGATWTFRSGTPTVQQRAAFKMEVCRSPGDVATRQRNWPLATPGVSCYNDVGTSYLVNMKWWDTSGFPGNFTQRFNAGVSAISAIRASAWFRPLNNYVWIHDQVADVVPYSGSSVTPGEFGGKNMSVCGYLDGRAAYIKLVPNALFGPG